MIKVKEDIRKELGEAGNKIREISENLGRLRVERKKVRPEERAEWDNKINEEMQKLAKVKKEAAKLQRELDNLNTRL